MLAKGLIATTVHSMGRSIIDGEWEPGSILPTEIDLAARYGVGRNAMREAVKVLAGKGLIKTARRYGSRVAEKAQWNSLDADVIGWRLTDRSSHAQFRREVAQLRELIEPGAAAMAASNASDAERRQIVDLAKAMQENPSADAIEMDITFHMTILAATHNTLIQALRNPLEVMLRTLFNADLQLEEAGLSYDPNPAIHVALASAIAGARPEEARHIATAIVIRGAEGADRLEQQLRSDER
jgi:DNA-binding FadR family transcriptional regulator